MNHKNTESPKWEFALNSGVIVFYEGYGKAGVVRERTLVLGEDDSLIKSYTVVNQDGVELIVTEDDLLNLRSALGAR